MERRRLGQSGLVVSSICMGTMTFGSQCDEQQSFSLCNQAWDAGIDFFDTAEVYPVPPRGDTVGMTESILGRWMQTKPRDAMLVATKVTGPAHGWFSAPVRESHCALDRHQIRRACEGSLRRLKTDYIDLYQIHWPDHGMRIEETLGALSELQREGKVRAIGCSNETCWGLMKSLWVAEKYSSARYDSVQNNFSLINRRCESELAQVCRREGVSLLPYSPLGGGVLTGKYNPSLPKGARFTAYLEGTADRQRNMALRFVNPRTLETVNRLKLIAERLEISLAALALAWSKQHDFVASTIVGATNVTQLNESLQAAHLVLDDETLQSIDQIDLDLPNPMSEDGLRKL